jgi:hypothetical protein
MMLAIFISRNGKTKGDARDHLLALQELLLSTHSTSVRLLLKELRKIIQLVATPSPSRDSSPVGHWQQNRSKLR